MRQSRFAHAHGFALAEAVTALFVVAVGLFGSFQMFQFYVKEIRAVNEFGTASRIIRNEIETLRALPFDAIEAGAGRSFISTSPESGALAEIRAFTDVTPDPALPARLKRITAVVRWRSERGRSVERRLTTVVSRGEAP